MEFLDVEEVPLCSFSLTQFNLVHQAIYVCNTCFTSSNSDKKCCCGGCAAFCHIGHDIEFFAYGRGYCDCGAESCTLYQKSINDFQASSYLKFDEESRIEGTMESSINIYPFQSFPGHSVSPVLQTNIGRLRDQCLALVNFSKDTFWLSHFESPRCILESIALDILRFHTRMCDPSTYRSLGAEFWVQVKEPNAASSGGVDLHYDKDERIAELFGLGVYPQLSTVTYLTSDDEDSDCYQAPTLVFSATANDNVGDSIEKCFVSRPKVGKHIAFDGRYLHGAPAQFSSSSSLRMTFLVNVWMNHHPENIQKLPDLFINSINETARPASSESNKEQPTIVYTTNTDTDLPIVKVASSYDSDGNWEIVPFISSNTDWGKDDSETGISLKFWLPRGILRKDGSKVERGFHLKPKKKLSGVLDITRTDTFVLDFSSRKIIVGSNALAYLDYDSDSDSETDFEIEGGSTLKVA